MTEIDIFRYSDFIILDDNKTIHFNYELTHDNKVHQLTETLVFPNSLAKDSAIKRGLRALHIALGISYYKIFLPSKIIHPYKMSASEADFWNDVYQNGLGEFLYVNKITKDRVASFAEQNGHDFDVSRTQNFKNIAILGIGGGKDSIVAGETLKNIGVLVEGFVMATGEQLGQSKKVADVMKIPLYAVGRTLDPSLMNLQMQPGAHKGHIPISLIFGLVGVVAAISKESRMVVVANESSASTPTTEWKGSAVNHQWSKSFDFEKSLQSFVKENITPEVTYFSAIRPLTSVAVAKKFARLPQYFEVFTSDNFVFRIDRSKRPDGRWSLESPKSLSSYILLSPWLSEKNMDRIFTIDFLNKEGLVPLFKELTGLQGHPPLDCVGTVDELVLSLNLAFGQGKFLNKYLMGVAKTSHVIQNKDWKVELDKMLQLQPDEAFPKDLKVRLREGLAE